MICKLITETFLSKIINDYVCKIKYIKTVA